ncbi:MAG TPA: AGE family epimerase/isomerase [Gemmatimonadaceae bacterium]|nr:AGE family epimerase/isomerase [Gemmatimonadaceae bacterium]
MPRRSFLPTAALALAACTTSGPRPAAEAPLPAGERTALAAELRRSFREQLLAPWYPRAIDREHGGFLSQFDADWKPTGPQDKMIVSQARHVWTNARAAQFLADTSYVPAARHGFRFLRDVMWDREQGGFYWLVARDGTPRREADGRLVKQAYGTAFGIYALAGYYDATRDPEALRLAQDAFRWLDRHAHDPQHGGYFNYLERDGTPMRAGYRADAPKDQNSSIHILEAYAELYPHWPNDTLRARLQEMLGLIRDRIRVDPGYLTLFHTADWRPVSWRDSSEAARRADRYFHDHVSFGHDVETAYLLLEASHVLGLEDEEPTERAAKQMVDHALRTGWDQAAGGFVEGGYYYPGRPTLVVVDSTKNWWAQAEGLNTLLLMAERYPRDPLRYADRFRQLWSYVKANLIDQERGGWYAGGLDRQPQMRQADKGHIWKATYHESRAYINVIKRLDGRGVP